MAHLDLAAPGREALSLESIVLTKSPCRKEGCGRKRRWSAGGAGERRRGRADAPARQRRSWDRCTGPRGSKLARDQPSRARGWSERGSRRRGRRRGERHQPLASFPPHSAQHGASCSSLCSRRALLTPTRALTVDPPRGQVRRPHLAPLRFDQVADPCPPRRACACFPPGFRPRTMSSASTLFLTRRVVAEWQLTSVPPPPPPSPPTRASPHPPRPTLIASPCPLAYSQAHAHAGVGPARRRARRHLGPAQVGLVLHRRVLQALQRCVPPLYLHALRRLRADSSPSRRGLHAVQGREPGSGALPRRGSESHALRAGPVRPSFPLSTFSSQCRRARADSCARPQHRQGPLDLPEGV